MKELKFILAVLLLLTNPALRSVQSFRTWNGRQRPPTQLATALDLKLASDLVIAGALGFGVDPLVERVFNATHHVSQSPDDVKFESTLAFGAADSIATSAKIFGALCIGEALTELLPGLEWPSDVSLREAAPSVAFTVWAALTISTIKRTLFQQTVAGDKLGRVSLFNNLVDAVVGLVAAVLVLDELKIDIGVGVQSAFTAGGVGALAFSLASKNLAEQIVGGFMIRSWDAFKVGDAIKLGDGTEGTVTQIGLVESELLGADNIPILIPNAQLVTQRVSNYNHITESQVVQNLRFKYSDLNRVPEVLDDIKVEIEKTCPDLITDGSKPFRAVLTAYEPDHIQTQVNCHFKIPPNSGEFVMNREQVLLAIARALAKHKIEFALPSIFYQTNGANVPPPPPQ